MDLQKLNFEEITLKLYHYCQSLTSSKWIAEDLTQETLMKYIIILKNEPHRHINMTFLYTVARNLFIDQKRKNKEISIELYDYYNSSKDFIEWDSLLEVLYSTLPFRQAMLITLKDVFLYTSKEIAEMLRVRDQTVKTALHRARLRLKENDRSNEETIINEFNDSRLIKELLYSIKNAQPYNIFYYYRLLETENYKVYCNKTITNHVIFLSDPDGNIIQIHQNNKL
ncbi:RNA polymerase sigma factor [Bacillus sp. SD088]|uniref:RNA polymerase sigma factor n=1 Tax=Bacillus sp. SD088 TaxID=2782012 RepID=UPI001A966C6C|nr:RNA polymerase sigma factor [Bacillus sp. SD088]MBO0994846.1 RNA polymerase sigma factor [Bacillus sp. SD088]